jgi:hypothetical protein
MVSDCRLDDRGSIPGRGKGFFSVASVSRSALRPTQPPAQWVGGGGDKFSGSRARPWRDTDHSSISIALVMNEKELYFLSP